MLTIRLSRIGKKNKPMYRIIISEKARDPYGRALEILGSYNPYSKKLQSEDERIKYWISKGAGMSPTANNLLVKHNIIKGKKVKASITKKKKETDKQEKQKPEKIEENTAKAPKEETKKEEKIEEKAKEEIKTENAAEETEKEKKETSEAKS